MVLLQIMKKGNSSVMGAFHMTAAIALVTTMGTTCTVARTQAVAWQIPAAGAVEYERTLKERASPVCRTRRAAQEAALSQAVPRRYLPSLPPAPVVCQGELDDKQQGLVGQIADLRDVIRALACNLSGRTAASARFPRLLPYGDVGVRGSWSRADEAGAQRLVATVTARPPKRVGKESKQRTARLAALCVAGARGGLRIERHVDLERGHVVSFGAELELVVQEGASEHRRLVIRDGWQLLAVRDNQDFDFRKRVAAAIRSGADWLRSSVLEQRSYLRPAASRAGERHYGSGRLALALLAMLHAHVPATDKAIQRGFADLRGRRMEDAYSLAASLMAMAALSRRTSLKERDRKLASRWLTKLLSCTDPRGEREQRLRFNYTAGPRYDTSLQQYGLLGLRAAGVLQLVIPKGAFAAAGRHLLDVQQSAGSSYRWTRASYEDVRLASAEQALRPRVAAGRLRGFAYRDASEPPFGSMTSAGISGLLLVRDGLLAEAAADSSSKGRNRALLAQINKSCGDGFAWLSAKFSVRCNPGDAERADNHWSYWLYCLERCCELDDIARLDGRDWYYEGGLQLLRSQQKSGAFRSTHASTLQLDATCFAILFLCKASASGPITGG
ncbi:MAG: hypothetical protein AB8H80_05185 [Planctomycetota bacterium]